MSMFDSMRDQIIGFIATNNMWAETSGDVESPTGFFGRIDIDVEDLALAVLEEWQFGIGMGVVLDVRPADLIGHWVVICTDQGFTYVSGYDTQREANDEWNALEHAYSEWIDAEDEDGECLPCGCTPHVTRMSTFGTAVYCETEGHPYCNFEHTCDEEN